MLTDYQRFGILYVVATMPGYIAPLGEVLDGFHELRSLGWIEWRTPNPPQMDHGWYPTETAPGLDFLTGGE